ncbi:MAG: prolipoprotein diacylglyceryl transferase [Candidatus Omnitrophota bacterium]|nr:MAG: prolipoprotein diacylglyceryl transferase [Candidatus Omnitrophota bacterium]
MYPVLIKLGPVTIYTYGIFVFLGLLLGYFVSLREAKRLGIDCTKFTDIIFWTAVIALIGARIFYVIMEYKWFIQRPLEIILSRSGFVFYGGVIFGFIPLYFLTKKYKIDSLKMLDSLGLGLPLGHSLGRLGCFFYGCCYGKPTDSVWGVLFPLNSPAGMLAEKVIPTQLISSFFLFLIFIVLLFIRKYKKFRGQIFLYYLVLYGIFRFIIEFFRGDERGQILFFTTAQIISIILVGMGCFLFFKWRKKA